MGCVLSAAGLNFDSDFLVALQFKPTESDSRIPYRDHHPQSTPCLPYTSAHPHIRTSAQIPDQPPTTTIPTPNSSPMLAQMRLAQTTNIDLKSPGYLTASSFLLARAYGFVARSPMKAGGKASRRVGELLGSLRQPVSRCLMRIA